MKPSSANRTLMEASEKSVISPAPTATRASMSATSGRAITSKRIVSNAGSDASMDCQPSLALRSGTKSDPVSDLASPARPPTSPVHAPNKVAVATKPQKLGLNMNTPQEAL
jgi:hypothetical protein